MIKNICFDLGGTLIDVRKTWETCWSYQGRDDILVPMVNQDVTYKDLAECPAFNRYQLGEIDDKTYIRNLAKYLFTYTSKCRPKPKIYYARRIHDLILGYPYDGAFFLLLHLQKEGFKTGCIANTNPMHWEVLSGEDYPSIAIMDYHVLSYKIGCLKPDPKMFLEYEKVSGCQPHEILYFDNVQENVEAAIKHGWNAHLIDEENSIYEMKVRLQNMGLIKDVY